MAVNFIREPEPPKGTLKKADLFALAIGACIGAGVVTHVVPGMGMTGNSVWLAYIVAILYGALLISPLVFISSALRLGGGNYSIVCDFLGSKAGGVFSVAFVTQALGFSMMGVAAAAYIADLIPALSSPLAQRAVAALLLTFFYVINLMGINAIAKIQKYMTFPLIGALLMYIIFGLAKMKNPVFNFSDPGFFANGFARMNNGVLAGGFFAAVMLFTYSTQGYRDAITYGRFAEDARKDIPHVLLFCVPVLIILYGGVALVTAGSTTLEEFAGSTSLVVTARNNLPGVLFVIFIILGPIFALFTTLNASFAGFSIVISQFCSDGWLPKVLANKNKHGIPKWSLTLVYAITILPILLGFSITTITSNVQLFISIVNMLLNIAYFRLPTKYPEAWESCRLHIPNGLYYLICTISLALNLLIFVNSCLSLTRVVVIVSIAVLIVCIVYALYREKSGDVTLRTSVWDITKE